MNKIKRSTVSIIVFLSMFSSACFALSTTYNNVYQTNAGDYLHSLKDTIFERDTYDIVGAGVSIRGVYDLDGNYSVPVGTTWTWQLYRVEDENGNTVNQLLSDYPITYQGEVGSCKTMWNVGRCTEASGWAVNWTYPCAPEGRYRVQVLYNGNIVGQDEFSPSRYTPDLEIFSPDVVSPRLQGDTFASKTMRTIEPETFFIRVRVDGVAGRFGQCRVSLPNTTVRLTNAIKPVSGGHEHFSSNNELGTMRYVKYGEFDVLNPDIPDTNDTVIEGKSTTTGNFYGILTAGDFGVTETVTVEAKREATVIHPDDIIAEIKTYDIDVKASNLLEMTQGTASGEFFFSFGGSCKHNPTARWVVPEMKSSLTKLDAKYKNKFGHRISFNDASTQFGGVFDNGSNAGRDSLCHQSHRRGNDIDINRLDENIQWMELLGYTENGLWKPRLHFVNTRAQYFGLTRVNEKNSIHYRFINY